MKKMIVTFPLLLSLLSCSSPCKVCEVLIDGNMIEKYEGCEDETRKLSKEFCEEMAKQMEGKCECKDKEESS